MKKIIPILLIATIFCFSVGYSFNNIYAKEIDKSEQDILYEDIIISALAPTIQETLIEYYKNIIIDSPNYDSSTIKIISLGRPNGDRTWLFNINIEVNPYIGPHIPIGKDILSIQLDSNGKQTLLDFKHLEDRPLPERYQDSYIK